MYYIMNKSAAVLIGIDYINSNEIRLRGCWNDAMLVYQMAISDSYKYPKESVELLMDNVIDSTFRHNKTSKEALVRSLYELALKSWSDDLDRVLVSYSGHGSNQADTNGDEADGRDEGLCPADVMYKGLLLDDDLINIFNKFNPKTRIYLVVDCCHSGSILDLPYNIDGTRDCVNPKTNIKPHIILLSGCKDPEVAAESYNVMMRKYCGALTAAMSDLFQSGNMVNLGLVEFYEQLSAMIKTRGYSQNIVISSSRPITNDYKMFL